jgi:hypothetical protein
VRHAVHSALLLLLLTQFLIAEIKYFENGQPTRTGADAAMFIDTPTRKKIDLAGSWQLTMDGKEWKQVAVPGAYDWVGKVTFRRTFEITPQMLEQYSFSLVAYGINYQSEITINGNFVGRHVGGYSSFIFPLQPHVLQVGKENTITVDVDNELTPTTTLPLRQQVGGWRSYGGIYRDIYLLATPKLFIEQANVRTRLSADRKKAEVSVTAEVTDRMLGMTATAGKVVGLQLDLMDKLTGEEKGRSALVPFTVFSNKSVPVEASFVVNEPKLWSPEIPDLYVLKCKIIQSEQTATTVLDEYDIDIGFRDLRWTNGRLFLNDSLTILKGVVWMEDHPTFGSAMTYESMERDVAMIKALGANLIRFQYPPHPYLLNLCDRYGVLATEEIPVVNVPSQILMTEHYQDLAVSYLKAMLARDEHHVSILAWGIGDNIQTNVTTTCDYINTARNILHARDERVVYFVTNNVDDACRDYIDVLALNVSTTDVKTFRQIIGKAKEELKSTPLFVARYGLNVEPGNRNGYSDPKSMEAQARYISQFYDAMKDMKIAGGAILSFSDWRSDRPALTTHAADAYLQTMGIVNYQREQRTAFAITRSLFNGEKIPALPVGNYTAETPVVFVIAGLVVLISFAFFYNSNRRFRECVNRSLLRTYNFFADIRDQRIISNVHSFFLVIVFAVTWSTILASVLYFYRENLLLDNLLSQFLSDGEKEWLIGLVKNPGKFVSVISVLLAVKVLFLTLLVKLFSTLVRAHVYWYHAFSVTVWSMMPYVILIPIAMILYRLMETEIYLHMFGGAGMIITVVVVMRLFKGIAIIYDVYPVKVYAGGILVIVIVGAAVYGYFEYTQSAPMYVKYLLQTVQSSM